MSEDRFTEVTEQSWFGRIGGAIKGVIAGFIFLVIAFPLLFWNEGRAVKEYKTLKEGGSSVISVSAEKADPANNEKLIHLTGKATTEETLTDDTFGISVSALKLRREVEMYQWKESSESKTEKKVGGGSKKITTYSYSKVWSSSVINSSNFKESSGHTNPGTIPFESDEKVASPIYLGDFTLSYSLAAKISNYEKYAVTDGMPVPAAITEHSRLHDGTIYFGTNPADPQIGDVRVKFSVAMPAEISVMAQQNGNTFQPYRASTGGTIELLEMGALTADAMIQKAEARNAIMTWVLRLIGFLLMLGGFALIFKPLSVLADVLPILGNIVGAGTGIIAFLLALMLSFITIAIAWIFYRPVLGIALIIVAGAALYLIISKLRSAKTARSSR